MIDIDSNEPIIIQSLLNQTLPINITALNANSWADYRWKMGDGRFKNVERKTWAELLQSVDHVEAQLLKHQTNQPEAELVFLLEGGAISTATGSQIIKQTTSGVWIKGMPYRARMSGIYAWLQEVERYCLVMPTTTTEESAVALAAMYNSDQKAEHSTFKRHIKQVDYHINPQVMMLMGVAPGLGPKRSEALIRKFGTVYNALTASESEWVTVEGIGRGLAQATLKRIGRWDV